MSGPCPPGRGNQIRGWRAVALEERRVVQTAVRLADGGGLYNLGSGYLIADGMVLTAAHVLAPAADVTAREGQPAMAACLGGDLPEATVAWADAVWDVAVLSCPGLLAGGAVRWGCLTGADPVDWGAAGFPVASRDAQGGRQVEHAYGRTSPISGRAAGADRGIPGRDRR